MSLNTKFFKSIHSQKHDGFNYNVIRPLGAPIILFSKKENTPLASLHMVCDDPETKCLFTKRPYKSSTVDFQGLITQDNKEFGLAMTNLTPYHINYNILKEDSTGLNRINSLRPFETYIVKCDKNDNMTLVLSSMKDEKSEEKVTVGKAEGSINNKATYYYLSVCPEEKTDYTDYFRETVWTCVDFFYLREKVLKRELKEDWFNVVENDGFRNRHLININQPIGINTVGASLKNANRDLRNAPPNPKMVVSPWLQQEVEAEMGMLSMGAEIKPKRACKKKCKKTTDNEVSNAEPLDDLVYTYKQNQLKAQQLMDERCGKLETFCDKSQVIQCEAQTFSKKNGMMERLKAKFNSKAKTAPQPVVQEAVHMDEENNFKGIFADSDADAEESDGSEEVDQKANVDADIIKASYIGQVKGGKRIEETYVDSVVKYDYALASVACKIGLSISDKLTFRDIDEKSFVDDAKEIIRKVIEDKNKSLLTNIERIFESDECIVCLDKHTEKKLDCVLYQCGHKCVHHECGKELTKCPLCQTRITCFIII